MTPKEYIENIKYKQLNSDKEFILDSLTAAIDRLQKTFPRYGSFLMEFIQNADDAGSNSLKFELLNNSISIWNDGRPFNFEDVKSICKVGRSSKSPRDYIGYLGVGFKAVFLISDCVEIYSGEFKFKFDKNFWEDPSYIPWQIIPLWIDEPQIEFNDQNGNYTTLFNLFLKENILVEKIREEIKPEHLSSKIILFLRNIKEIKIKDTAKNYERKILKCKINNTSEYEIYQIKEYENDNLTQTQWIVFRLVCSVPQNVKEDLITKEWERENIEKREVLVAFLLDEEDNLIKERGTAHIGIFSFLPLKEIPSGLNFLIQTDFLTSPGRGEIIRECLWNYWLADEIYKLIVNKCIPVFLRHDKWKMNFTQILYSQEGGHELFEEHIKKPLRNYLENNEVLITEDETFAKAEELIKIENEIRELVTDEDINMLYPNKKIIHNECKTHSYLETKIEKLPSDILSFLRSSKGRELTEKKANLKDVNWFKKLFSILVDKYNYSYFCKHYPFYNKEHDKFWNEMRDFPNPIILTQDYNLAKINECFTNPQNLEIPQPIKNRFKIVHQELVNDEKFKEFIKKLNEERYLYPPPADKVIKKLTQDDIERALQEYAASQLTPEEWENLADADRIKKIKSLKDLWRHRNFSLENYNFLTLKSKNGNWVKPEKILFSKEYQPDDVIENLVEENLLDLPLEFLSPEFIENESDDEIRKWKRFFEELGVNKIIEDKKNEIVQRIAILTSLKYEKEKGREARELGESERLGYDIESKSENEERFIEVKGTYETSYDIFLTVNEFKSLKEKQDRYFIYIVTNALKNPILYVCRGDKLLEIEDIKVIMPFSKWKTLIEDEFQP